MATLFHSYLVGCAVVAVVFFFCDFTDAKEAMGWSATRLNLTLILATLVWPLGFILSVFNLFKRKPE